MKYNDIFPVVTQVEFESYEIFFKMQILKYKNIFIIWEIQF